MTIRDRLGNPSVVYDTYWSFAAERQTIFHKRLAGEPPPWTTDEILLEYRFTNVYRAADRTTQYLIRRVIYRDDLPTEPAEVFFRILLFKLFNHIGTWELLERQFNTVTWAEYAFREYDHTLSAARGNGQPIYSGAYLMPPAKCYGFGQKHQNHLALIEQAMKDRLPDRIAGASSMEEVFQLLRGLPSIGDFLAYQLAIDINYSTITDFSEMDFVRAGPGARDGIRKCFPYATGVRDDDIIRLVTERHEEEFHVRGLPFRNLWGRPLQLVDCQNLFCEVDKYARRAHPEVRGRSCRTRLKRRYRGSNPSQPPWFPPKWELNGSVELIPKPAHSARGPELEDGHGF